MDGVLPGRPLKAAQMEAAPLTRAYRRRYTDGSPPLQGAQTKTAPPAEGLQTTGTAPPVEGLQMVR
ncbi:hypothetical protein FIBSPDRAFT_970282 [Athelia psychrophila]|uniref:Uncharacterized protein n=1 Tax=Athelia psychrophila TaxID=1759441 RepID=A0A167SSU0_9AGAM|nr:hypothetical protein FIBSPDRAFT_970282 [Fibularhizoctonia sp. CBS 109695]